MIASQYELFRDLDRHCATPDVSPAECVEAVRKKRAIIESEISQSNPLVREVIEGKATFTSIYNSYSRALRGYRRFLPLPHDAAQNERLEHLGRIIPNVGHFRRRSLFSADNPIMTAIYAMVASLAIGMVWNLGNQDVAPTDAAGAAAEGRVELLFAVLSGFAGFGIGLFAMLRYRTRDKKRIHAREAAAYMDLNYECYRKLDDESWAHFMTLKQQPRPDTIPGSGTVPLAAAGDQPGYPGGTR